MAKVKTDINTSGGVDIPEVPEIEGAGAPEILEKTTDKVLPDGMQPGLPVTTTEKSVGGPNLFSSSAADYLGVDVAQGSQAVHPVLQGIDYQSRWAAVPKDFQALLETTDNGGILPPDLILSDAAKWRIYDNYNQLPLAKRLSVAVIAANLIRLRDIIHYVGPKHDEMEIDDLQLMLLAIQEFVLKGNANFSIDQATQLDNVAFRDENESLEKEIAEVKEDAGFVASKVADYSQKIDVKYAEIQKLSDGEGSWLNPFDAAHGPRVAKLWREIQTLTEKREPYVTNLQDLLSFISDNQKKIYHNQWKMMKNMNVSQESIDEFLWGISTQGLVPDELLGDVEKSRVRLEARAEEGSVDKALYGNHYEVALQRAVQNYNGKVHELNAEIVAADEILLTTFETWTKADFNDPNEAYMYPDFKFDPEADGFTAMFDGDPRNIANWKFIKKENGVYLVQTRDVYGQVNSENRVQSKVIPTAPEEMKGVRQDLERAMQQNPYVNQLQKAGSELLSKFVPLQQLMAGAKDDYKSEEFIEVVKEHAQAIKDYLTPAKKAELLETITKAKESLKILHQLIPLEWDQSELEQQISALSQQLDGLTKFIESDTITNFCDTLLSKQFRADDFSTWWETKGIVTLGGVIGGVMVMGGVALAAWTGGISLSASAWGMAILAGASATGGLLGAEAAVGFSDYYYDTGIKAGFQQYWSGEITGTELVQRYGTQWAYSFVISFVAMGAGRALAARVPAMMASEDPVVRMTGLFINKFGSGIDKGFEKIITSESPMAHLFKEVASEYVQEIFEDVANGVNPVLGGMMTLMNCTRVTNANGVTLAMGYKTPHGLAINYEYTQEMQGSLIEDLKKEKYEDLVSEPKMEVKADGTILLTIEQDIKGERLVTQKTFTPSTMPLEIRQAAQGWGSLEAAGIRFDKETGNFSTQQSDPNILAKQLRNMGFYTESIPNNKPPIMVAQLLTSEGEYELVIEMSPQVSEAVEVQQEAEVAQGQQATTQQQAFKELNAQELARLQLQDPLAYYAVKEYQSDPDSFFRKAHDMSPDNDEYRRVRDTYGLQRQSVTPEGGAPSMVQAGSGLSTVVDASGGTSREGGIEGVSGMSLAEADETGGVNEGPSGQTVDEAEADLQRARARGEAIVENLQSGRLSLGEVNGTLYGTNEILEIAKQYPNFEITEQVAAQIITMVADPALDRHAIHAKVGGMLGDTALSTDTAKAIDSMIDIANTAQRFGVVPNSVKPEQLSQLFAILYMQRPNLAAPEFSHLRELPIMSATELTHVPLVVENALEYYTRLSRLEGHELNPSKMKVVFLAAMLHDSNKALKEFRAVNDYTVEPHPFFNATGQAIHVRGQRVIYNNDGSVKEVIPGQTFEEAILAAGLDPKDVRLHAEFPFLVPTLAHHDGAVTHSMIQQLADLGLLEDTLTEDQMARGETQTEKDIAWEIIQNHGFVSGWIVLNSLEGIGVRTGMFDADSPYRPFLEAYRAQIKSLMEAQGTLTPEQIDSASRQELQDLYRSSMSLEARSVGNADEDGQFDVSKYLMIHWSKFQNQALQLYQLITGDGVGNFMADSLAGSILSHAFELRLLSPAGDFSQASEFALQWLRGGSLEASLEHNQYYVQWVADQKEQNPFADTSVKRWLKTGVPLYLSVPDIQNGKMQRNDDGTIKMKMVKNPIVGQIIGDIEKAYYDAYQADISQNTPSRLALNVDELTSRPEEEMLVARRRFLMALQEKGYEYGTPEYESAVRNFETRMANGNITPESVPDFASGFLNAEEYRGLLDYYSGSDRELIKDAEAGRRLQSSKGLIEIQNVEILETLAEAGLYYDAMYVQNSGHSATPVTIRLISAQLKEVEMNQGSERLSAFGIESDGQGGFTLQVNGREIHLVAKESTDLSQKPVPQDVFEDVDVVGPETEEVRTAAARHREVAETIRNQQTDTEELPYLPTEIRNVRDPDATMEQDYFGPDTYLANLDEIEHISTLADLQAHVAGTKALLPAESGSSFKLHAATTEKGSFGDPVTYDEFTEVHEAYTTKLAELKESASEADQDIIGSIESDLEQIQSHLEAYTSPEKYRKNISDEMTTTLESLNEIKKFEDVNKLEIYSKFIADTRKSIQRLKGKIDVSGLEQKLNELIVAYNQRAQELETRILANLSDYIPDLKDELDAVVRFHTQAEIDKYGVYVDRCRQRLEILKRDQIVDPTDLEVQFAALEARYNALANFESNFESPQKLSEEIHKFRILLESMSEYRSKNIHDKIFDLAENFKKEIKTYKSIGLDVSEAEQELILLNQARMRLQEQFEVASSLQRYTNQEQALQSNVAQHQESSVESKEAIKRSYHIYVVGLKQSANGQWADQYGNFIGQGEVVSAGYYKAQKTLIHWFVIEDKITSRKSVVAFDKFGRQFDPADLEGSFTDFTSEALKSSRQWPVQLRVMKRDGKYPDKLDDIKYREDRANEIFAENGLDYGTTTDKNDYNLISVRKTIADDADNQPSPPQDPNYVGGKGDISMGPAIDYSQDWNESMPWTPDDWAKMQEAARGKPQVLDYGKGVGPQDHEVSPDGRRHLGVAANPDFDGVVREPTEDAKVDFKEARARGEELIEGLPMEEVESGDKAFERTKGVAGYLQSIAVIETVQDMQSHVGRTLNRLYTRVPAYLETSVGMDQIDSDGPLTYYDYLDVLAAYQKRIDTLAQGQITSEERDDLYQYQLTMLNDAIVLKTPHVIKERVQSDETFPVGVDGAVSSLAQGATGMVVELDSVFEGGLNDVTMPGPALVANKELENRLSEANVYKEALAEGFNVLTMFSALSRIRSVFERLTQVPESQRFYNTGYSSTVTKPLFFDQILIFDAVLADFESRLNQLSLEQGVVINDALFDEFVRLKNELSDPNMVYHNEGATPLSDLTRRERDQFLSPEAKSDLEDILEEMPESKNPFVRGARWLKSLFGKSESEEQ